jgi:spermidine synthase
MDKMFIITISVFLFLVFVFIGNYNIQQMHSGGFYKTSQEVEMLGNVVYYEEGVYSTVSVRELTREEPVRQHAKALYVNGIGQGSTNIKDLRVSFLLAYIPHLIKPELKKGLVIGLGTGMTSGQLSQFTDVTTVEIEPEVVKASQHFRLFNLDVLENPNHTLIIDDGRNWLLRNEEKYDIIISEPTSTWQSFSTQLYSEEFLELVKEDLNEDGLFVNWVPIYSMSADDFKSFYKTFNSIFIYNVAFVNIKPDEPGIPARFETSEIIIIGSKNEVELTKENLIQNYNSLPETSKQFLEIIHLNSGDGIYNLFLFDNTPIKNYAKDAKIITDDNLLLEFSTAKNVLNQNSKEVINDIEKFISE